MAHTVIRTDLMSGTKQCADLVSIRFKDADENNAAVDNGVIAELGALEKDNRDVFTAKAATSASKLDDCVIVAGVEVMYDERKKNLDEYFNEAGKAVRGYVLRTGNMFGVTADGFVGKTAPAIDGEVGIGADGKLNASGTGFGKCVAIEAAGRYTFYVIKITKD